MPDNQAATLSTNDIRSEFLRYFNDHGHTVVASASLVPANDNTLLFANAGMVPFKDLFLGKEKRAYQRATSAQRCVRAGGKHNDLERVGYTARHHTFFEMLGNFSFGDYFKREAIQFAWRFLTVNLKLPAEKLWVTVFRDDDEAAAIWLDEIKIVPVRFSRSDQDDNFWMMVVNGPCGPCSEIFYDHGPHIAGGPPGSADADGDRYIEIWNLVFMQYDRAADGTLTPLPRPSVDTGMGLERIAAVMQHVNNNYDIDLFQGLIKAIAHLSQTRDLTNTSLRVIADHIRSCAFMIADGVMPTNEGRGYVLRRIIRRALRHGNKLGLTEPFFYRLVAPLAAEMGSAYPELLAAQASIEKALLQEEEQFNLTLTQGLKLFEQALAGLTTKTVPGDVLFKLYDTYGFPIDLTADIARELDYDVDMPGFEHAMAQQRDRSRQTGKFTADYNTGVGITTPTQFIGHKDFSLDVTPDSGTIIALYHDGKAVDAIGANQNASVILERTPFYAESGGQVGDQGMLFSGANQFQVQDTVKQGQAHVHVGVMTAGNLQVGMTVQAQVDAARRAATVLNHTATHLLHAALRQVLGTNVTQKGSLVEPERLRFDFAHGAPLTPSELQTIELHVNAEIRRNHAADVAMSTPAQAIAAGAMALFGEKYGDEVRVVGFGASKELCGGTHAYHTGDIGIFKITAETGVAAGIRRIEAVTGDGALTWLTLRDQQYQQKLVDADDRLRALEKTVDQLKTKLANSMSHDLIAQAIDLGGTKLISGKLDGIDPKSLRTVIDQIKSKLASAVIVLSVVNDGKVTIVAGVTKDQTSKIKAGELVNMLASQVGGKGGGRPDLAEAGGNQPENLDTALASVEAFTRSKLLT